MGTVSFAFVLVDGTWVDLDTLVETTAQGLRDAGALEPRYRGLDGLVATKSFGSPAQARVSPLPASLLQSPPPGPVLLDVADDVVPRPGNRDAKRAWRHQLARGWRDGPPLTGSVWAEVTLDIPGSLFGPLEVILDALEPVLGRDPRGRDWQEFFPNDDRVTWLRVRRAAGRAVRLRMGTLSS